MTSAALIAAAYVDDTIVYRPAGPDEAKTLKISSSGPVLDITRIAYDDTGRPIELLRRTVNALRVRIVHSGLRLPSRETPRR
jgi:DNA-binding GntR family transcriptional regulator